MMNKNKQKLMTEVFVLIFCHVESTICDAYWNGQIIYV